MTLFIDLFLFLLGLCALRDSRQQHQLKARVFYLERMEVLRKLSELKPCLEATEPGPMHRCVFLEGHGKRHLDRSGRRWRTV